MSHEHEPPDKRMDAVWKALKERFPERFAPSATEEAHAFLTAVKVGELETLQRMVQSNPDLLFVMDDYYGSPVRAATDTHPQIADYLAHVELQRLREGSIPKTHLYGAIHDLGEAAHAETGYRGCENLRAEAEPVVAGFLTHDHPEIRYIAINVLAFHWSLKHYVPTFQLMGRSDPEEHVRQIAVSAVGSVLDGTRDHDASRFLLRIFRDPVQPAWIRKSAYEGLVKVWRGFDAAHALFHRIGDRERAVEQAGTAGRSTSGTVGRNVWEEFVDWHFVAQITQEVEDAG